MATTSSPEKLFSFGSCAFETTSPNRDKLKPELKALNIKISFEEALKLNLAIDECIRKLNKYKRSTKEGKRAAMNIVLYFDTNRISVNEDRLKKV